MDASEDESDASEDESEDTQNALEDASEDASEDESDALEDASEDESDESDESAGAAGSVRITSFFTSVRNLNLSKPVKQSSPTLGIIDDGKNFRELTIRHPSISISVEHVVKNSINE